MTIDVHVHLERWPFRRLPGDDSAALVAKLRTFGVTQAWAGSFDALLHRDLAAVNARLAEVCRTAPKNLLLPFGSINPAMPFWEDDLRRCIDIHQMKGIRLYPAWHGYALDHPNLAALLKSAATRQLIVQIVLKLEDERTQHPLLRLQPVDAAPLLALVEAQPRLRLVLLNHHGIVKPELLKKLTQVGQVHADFGNVEGVDGVSALLQSITPARILFGSHFPFYYHESAVLKLREANLDTAHEKAIRHANAQRLLGQ